MHLFELDAAQFISLALGELVVKSLPVEHLLQQFLFLFLFDECFSDEFLHCFLGLCAVEVHIYFFFD
jgi:hypothetical protein